MSEVRRMSHRDINAMAQVVREDYEEQLRQAQKAQKKGGRRT